MRPYLALLAIAPLLCAQPKLQNAQQQTRDAAGGLDPVIRSILSAHSMPAWIAYAVPQVPGEHNMCCWNSNYQGCVLEPQVGTTAFPPNAAPVRLEGASEFFVFLRVEFKLVEKIRTISTDCSVDAGGLPVYWLTGVKAAQSATLLETLVSTADTRVERKLADSAISAIALHRDAAADGALDRMIAPAQPENIRRQAAFWLGNARGRHGYEALARMVKEDPSAAVRERVVFALAQNKEPAAMTAVVRAAKEDKSAHVRGQALSWLAQRGGRQAAEAAIRDSIANDADVEVKKKAVFALTQIPDGGGVAMLIELVRGNRNDAVQKQAMFWLGKSKDARAMQFYEQLLATK